MNTNSKPKKILIATPLYPPAIGGPSQYAKNLEQVWVEQGHLVSVVNFGKVLRWPSGLRHLLYFWNLLKVAKGCDFILILDTFSVALPAVLVGKILGRKTVIRTGGDFLWESYVERTGDLVLFRNFYDQSLPRFNLKEKLVYKIIKFVLHKTDRIVFSTDWQKSIFVKAYDLPNDKVGIIENYFGLKEKSTDPERKVFLAATRPLKWKNHHRLEQAFAVAKNKNPKIIFDDQRVPYDQFIEKMKQCYAVVLVSLGDISPNFILDAIRLNKPFILTKENGLESRLDGVGLRVNPEDVEDIAAKIDLLSNDVVYAKVKEGVMQFNFTHSWDEIGQEFIDLI